MFFIIKSLFLVCSIFVVCESGYVDTLGKCKINDVACQKELFQTVVKDISKTGVEELGIPQIDPIILKNVSISILNVIDITVIDGTAKGVKDCQVIKFDTNVEKERAYVELVCDFTVEGHYKVFSNNSLLKNLVGGEQITGDGNGKVKIEKLHIRLDFDFFIQRRNGEFYIKCKSDKVKYSFDVKGKMLFFADNLYIGKQESSKLVVGLLNQNWKTLMSSFGKDFADKAMEYMYAFLNKIFDTVPTKHFISDDLSPYARDE